MYLTENEYKEMGGALSGCAFYIAERKAEYLINAQAGGMTGRRIRCLSEIPQAVKDCMFELINLVSDNSKVKISSESQSQDGVSESVSYAVKTDDEQTAEYENIIYDFLYGGGCENLLYRGACI